MSEHVVLDFDHPLDPSDIMVGNVVVLHGKPRTIREVRSLGELPCRLPSLMPRMVAELGNGEAQVFYVLTCHGCGSVRAFPGLLHMAEWYGIAHANQYHVYCSMECVTKGVTDGSHE